MAVVYPGCTARRPATLHARVEESGGRRFTIAMITDRVSSLVDFGMVTGRDYLGAYLHSFGPADDSTRPLCRDWDRISVSAEADGRTAACPTGRLDAERLDSRN